jgi:polysaccharide export outer membrane protein
MRMLALSISISISMASAALSAQVPAAPSVSGQRSQAATAAVADTDYHVGAGDLLAISVLQVPDLKTSVRVSQQGAISLPLLGVVQVAGLSAADIEQRLADLLRRTYVKDPQVSVQVAEMESHPVSVVGAVAEPGVFQVRGPMKLLAVLSLARGVTEAAGDTVIVVPADASAKPVEVELKKLLESNDSESNLTVRAGDVVKVPSAPRVYVVGEVNKPGSFPMPRGERLTVLRAVALGEGLTPTAAKGDTVILRTAEDGSQTEIDIRLDRIMKADEPDPVLQGNDVIFVPGSGGKAAARAALGVLGRLISLRPF